MTFDARNICFLFYTENYRIILSILRPKSILRFTIVIKFFIVLHSNNLTMNPVKMGIFLVDDDDDDRIFFGEAFNSLRINHTLTYFEDGILLMDFLHLGQNLPDIIFLDLNMPGKSGMECLREIRSNSALRDIAVAIYSTSSLEMDIENAFISGANIYIRKPNEFESLQKILSKIISINWQYMVDGLNRENFIVNYND